LSSMPIHYLSTLDIPDGAIEVIDKARRNCSCTSKDSCVSIIHPVTFLQS
jgi:hypothetical protein